MPTIVIFRDLAKAFADSPRAVISFEICHKLRAFGTFFWPYSWSGRMNYQCIKSHFRFVCAPFICHPLTFCDCFFRFLLRLFLLWPYPWEFSLTPLPPNFSPPVANAKGNSRRWPKRNLPSHGAVDKGKKSCIISHRTPGGNIYFIRPLFLAILFEGEGQRQIPPSVRTPSHHSNPSADESFLPSLSPWPNWKWDPICHLSLHFLFINYFNFCRKSIYFLIFLP